MHTCVQVHQEKMTCRSRLPRRQRTLIAVRNQVCSKREGSEGGHVPVQDQSGRGWLHACNGVEDHGCEYNSYIGLKGL